MSSWFWCLLGFTVYNSKYNLLKFYRKVEISPKMKKSTHLITTNKTLWFIWLVNWSNFFNYVFFAAWYILTVKIGSASNIALCLDGGRGGYYLKILHKTKVNKISGSILNVLLLVKHLRSLNYPHLCPLSGRLPIRGYECRQTKCCLECEDGRFFLAKAPVS